jgi:APA family basic amino acid/polyamine antiporter
MNKDKTSLERSIGFLGGVSILTGIMVGSGIFFIGSYVLMRTDFSSGTSLLIWLIGGLITLMYGLIYAELGAMMPKAGGYYVYLKEAFGKPIGFPKASFKYT